jgi:hypothetical protein
MNTDNFDEPFIDEISKLRDLALYSDIEHGLVITWENNNYKFYYNKGDKTTIRPIKVKDAIILAHTHPESKLQSVMFPSVNDINTIINMFYKYGDDTPNQYVVSTHGVCRYDLSQCIKDIIKKNKNNLQELLQLFLKNYLEVSIFLNDEKISESEFIESVKYLLYENEECGVLLTYVPF